MITVFLFRTTLTPSHAETTVYVRTGATDYARAGRLNLRLEEYERLLTALQNSSIIEVNEEAQNV